MFRRKDGLWGDTISRPGQKPKYFYAKTKQELKRKMLEYQNTVDNGWTLEYLLESFVEEHGKTLREKTIMSYKPAIARINDAFPGIFAKNLTPAQVQAFIHGLIAKGYSRSTVQRPLDVLRMAYDYGIISPDSGINSNPCSAIRIKNLKPGKRNLMAREDVEIVKHSVNHPFGLFAFFCLYTGCRRGEALAITGDDIHDGKIYISKEVSWIYNSPTIAPPKTDSAVRTIPLLSPLAAVLPQSINGYLFSTNGGKTPLTQREYVTRWNGYCRECGLADFEIEEHKAANGRTYRKKIWHNRIVVHQCRHEFATMCLDAGLDEIDTQEIIGHSDIRTTQATYQHIRESRRASSINKLEQFVTAD